MEKLNEIINFLISPKNQVSLIIFLAVMGLSVLVSYQYVIPKIHACIEMNNTIKTSLEHLQGLENKKIAKDREEKKNLIKFDEVPVKVYTPSTPGLPVESASIDFVTTVISMFEKTGNSVMDISYKVASTSAAEQSALPSGVSVVQLVLTLNSSYQSLQDFIYMFYDYQFLGTIKSMKITPLKENKNVLETQLVIWLYVSQ